MIDKELYKKHSSKLYKGFEKQRMRQINKPRDVKIKLKVAIKLPKNFKGVYKHHIKVSNSVWNGMNLMNIFNSLYPLKKYNGMYSKFYKDKEGRVKLSRHGKQLLEKKKRVKN